MKNLSIFALSVFIFILAACQSNAQQKKIENTSSQSEIQVIQFHSEHRCATCIKIESLAKATLQKHFKQIPFILINADDKKNEKIAKQFEAVSTALFLYNPKTGKKKDLTDFAFMKAGNEQKFETELKKFIEEFLKS